MVNESMFGSPWIQSHKFDCYGIGAYLSLCSCFAEKCEKNKGQRKWGRKKATKIDGSAELRVSCFLPKAEKQGVAGGFVPLDKFLLELIRMASRVGEVL